ncbi:F-box and leucine-rich repeat protein 13 isoform X1 [Oryctolagus cuniculus]|uniref:F-box and leucine-rich repeat protein 13 isoform X1 n=1 Tax=Oryctolagus cuniculus TaxID=9986 RepID=UPI00387987A1
MASLRTASPTALLCGLLVMCPEDPLQYLEEMIIAIMENGLENLLWDMCIDLSMRPKLQRLSKTYLEQLFGLDDQLVTPELMIKACTFHTKNLVKTHFCTWRDIAIPHVNEDEILAEKMEKAITHYNYKLQKSSFHYWHSLAENQRRKLKEVLWRIQQMLYCHKLKVVLTNWRDKARSKTKMREDELILKHERQLKRWKSKLKFRVTTEETSSPELSSSEISFVGDLPECDISLLPEKAISQIFLYLSLRDIVICGQVCHAWMLMIQTRSLWNTVISRELDQKWSSRDVNWCPYGKLMLASPAMLPCPAQRSVVWKPSVYFMSSVGGQIDFSMVKNIIADKDIVTTLHRWRLNVLRLNFRGCVLRPRTLRSIGHCRNLQELNVSDCSTLTDELMRYISEGCPGVLYLNLSNTTITNRTMRLLPRHFYNLQNLSLAYCRKFTDKGLQYLSLGNGCHKLICLDLSGCTQISVQGFKNIANSCSGIMHLTINDMPTLTDNCVKALVEKCPSITSVTFIGSPHISDCAFKALTACNLRKIRFEGNKRITDACFKFIDKNYPNINHIYMSDCKGITDSSLKSLATLKQLTVLNLANCGRIGDMGIKHFLDGPVSQRLRELNLSNCVHLGDDSVLRLSERCPNLNYLSLRNCEHLTDQGIENIVNILSLVSVDLSGTIISNEGLMVLSRHKKLKELSLSDCGKITDVGIQAFCKSSRTLEHLDVSYCPQLSDDTIRALAIYCVNLTSLSVAGCPKITDAAMEMLSAKCHYLHILDVSGCVLLTDQILADLRMGCRQLRSLKMLYCRLISREAAKKMAAAVQRQEHSCNDPPRWFGYDYEGKPLAKHHGATPHKEDLEPIVRDLTYGSEEEAV